MERWRGERRGEMRERWRTERREREGDIRGIRQRQKRERG